MLHTIRNWLSAATAPTVMPTAADFRAKRAETAGPADLAARQAPEYIAKRHMAIRTGVARLANSALNDPQPLTTFTVYSTHDGFKETDAELIPYMTRLVPGFTAVGRVRQDGSWAVDYTMEDE
jgi:hypothetical protein